MSREEEYVITTKQWSNYLEEFYELENQLRESHKKNASIQSLLDRMAMALRSERVLVMSSIDLPFTTEEQKAHDKNMEVLKEYDLKNKQ